VTGRIECVRDDLLVAFRDEAEALDGIVAGLSEDDFSRPTNCPPWNVKELLTHIAIVVPPAGALHDAPNSKPPDIDEAADYYRNPDRRTAGYHPRIAADTQAAAANLEDGAAAARLLTTRWRLALEEWTTSDPDRVVETRQGTILLTDYAVTRLVSHAAHGLDLALSLGREPWTTPAALAVMRPVYVSLLGGPPPDEWSDQYFFACATGRRALTQADRAVAGPVADRFPLLS
jgi:uncharacterized protein (TIGR03083 family)